MKTSVTVTVDDEHQESIDAIAQELREHGMVVEDVLDTLGMITGVTEDPGALGRIPGVASVDSDLTVQLPDPDEDVQ